VAQEIFLKSGLREAKHIFVVEEEENILELLVLI
jgi:hypothetical protein